MTHEEILATLGRYVDALIAGSTAAAPLWNIEMVRSGKPNRWNYIDGCMITACLSLYNTTAGPRYLDFSRLSGYVILLFAVAIAIIYYLQSDKVDSKQSEEEQQAEGLAFPYELEDGKISVDSIFQFTGFNPDNENVEGENIAALTVVNQSEQHLASAQFTVKLADGAQLAFEITDLPAGQKAMIFEKENQVYELDDVCEEITDTAEFEDSSPVMADRLSAEVQETAVTLTNNSEEDLTDLLLHCHCVIDDACFGGLTYTYPIESIPAGQSASVDAVDCYLGQAAVVRVSQGNGEE